MKKLFATLLILLFNNQAFAQDENKAVEHFISNVGNKIIEIANDKSLKDKQKRDQIISEIDKIIDSNWISRFVLAKNYKTMTQEQKDKFSSLYRNFMINTYGPKFKNYNGRKFTVVSVDKQNIFYVAKCEFLPKTSDVPVEVSFRIKNNGKEFVVLDFVAEGVSLIETQRSEFNSTISQKGTEGFMKDLEKRVEFLKQANS